METTAFILFCFTVLLPASSSTLRKSREASSLSTTPPIEWALPLKQGTRDYMEMMCSVFDKPPKGCKLNLRGFAFSVTCNEGLIEDRLDGFPLYTLYINGTWAPTMPECKRFCKPPKKQLNVDVRCQLKGKNIDCSKIVPVGTEAIGRCKVGFLPTDKAADESIVCGETGNWSGHLIECEASACGMKNSTVAISPWIVTIHSKLSVESFGRYMMMFWASGTLISPHLVLTVASRLYWKKQTLPSDYVVIVGKYNTFYNSEGEIVPVREILIHPFYFGYDTDYAFDIALVVLGTSVSSMPACVDWDREFLITPGEIVTMSTLDEHDVKLEYVDYESCVSILEPEDRRLVAHDKFCSREINDGASLVEDGAGLMIEKNGVHYVKGVIARTTRDLRCSYNDIRYHLVTDLNDMTILHWLHQTKLTIDAAYNDT